MEASSQKSPEQELRERATERLKSKREFRTHLVMYVLVNAMLVVVWATTGAGYFWPIFVMAFWGIGVVMNGYTAYRGDAITEEQIEREMKSLR